MRVAVCALSLVLLAVGTSVHADAKKPIKGKSTAKTQAPAPAPTPAPAAQAPQAPNTTTFPRVTTNCEDVLAGINLASPTAAQTAQFIDEVQTIERETAQVLIEQNQLVRTSQIEEGKIFERLMFLVARGAKEEVLKLVKPVSDQMIQTTMQLTNVEKQLATTQKGSVVWVNLHEQFVTLSQSFGEQYGLYMIMMRNLQSIAQGNGAMFGQPIDARAAAGDTIVVLALSPQDPNDVVAKSTAAWILAQCDWNNQQHWLPNAKPIEAPTIGDIQFQFNKNIYALLAKLQGNLDQQKLAQTMWIKIIGQIAQGWLDATANQKVNMNESTRQFLFTMAGLAYDQLMMFKYLDRVQAVVDVTRRLDDRGNIVLSSDDQVLDLQIKTLMTYNDGSSSGNDFYLTFARIAYHSDVLDAIMAALKVRASSEVGSTTSQDLLNALIAARTKASKMENLQLIYPQNYPSQIRLAVSTLGAGLATAYGAYLGEQALAWVTHGIAHIPVIANAFGLGG